MSASKRSDIDALGSSIDWQTLFTNAIGDTKLSDLQKENIADLKLGRDAKTLRKIIARQPAQKFESVSKNALEKRSHWRISKVQRALPYLFEKGTKIRILDLGTGRGEFPSYFKEKFSHCESFGLDLETSLFEEKQESDAMYQGITVLSGSAERIPVAAKTFDLIVGFNSMEHFDDPQAVVDECERVLRPGGSVYFDFGPPFNSPYGPHLQNVCGLPYFHHLFTKEVVREALKIQKTNPYEGKNEWTLKQFEHLFLEHKKLECKNMVYECTWEHLWLPKELNDFNNTPPQELVVRAIRVALKKSGKWLPLQSIDPPLNSSVPQTAKENQIANQYPSTIRRKLRKLKRNPLQFFKDSRINKIFK